MGIWPIIFLYLLYEDGINQKIKSWPFIMFSFLAGAFILLPYFILRDYSKRTFSKRSSKIELIYRKEILILMSFMTFLLIILGICFGDIGNYLTYFLNDKFIFIMSIDFCILYILSVFAVIIDYYNRNMNKYYLLALPFLPILGCLLYLFLQSLLLSEKTD